MLFRSEHGSYQGAKKAARSHNLTISNIRLNTPKAGQHHVKRRALLPAKPAKQQIQLNDHNKQEYPPMHTAEHLLNATMVKTFGCPRSRNAHIERKKSKCDYILSSCPTAEQIQSIENKVNEAISQNLPVTVEYMTHEQAKDIVDLSKLPADASETLRIVRIGDYDACACIGLHVSNTSEVGTFKIISYDYDEERQTLRIRFKLIEKK